ncbi:phosphodiesterase [Pseudomonas sp. FW300-N1A1]|uniref:alkaline phosphatase D family protein n=1 Tax=Pseudomonas sp. FW300-N1A1 TaxID=2075555 RepID=UPI000CD13603|nr:alkaline phosphatase D family protein [Pseudomonas sp. FW300-N1A1]POA22089.1 phosphodiesterase [Pseudomonas sp. FW300-N1A1]
MFKPTVGPIIGHTTTHHTRIFLRGDLQKKDSVFAAIRYRRIGDTQWSSGIFAELDPLRDLSNVIALHHLHADTHYEYQAGWFGTDGTKPSPEALRQMPLQWPKEVYRFHTTSSEITTPRSYIVGSCRYLRMTLGVPSLPSKGDKIFGAINRLVQKSWPPVSALIMTGDQVYVDDMNLVSPDREYREILDKYRAAFSQPHIQALMASVPTYMILDDHEIEDNWPAKANSNDAALYRNAMAAYEIYQASHSPAHESLTEGQPALELKHYWYRFAQGDTEWFVTDSRTRRNLAVDDRRILDADQEQALLEWLINSPARVKFLVTSVMFYPDSKSDDGDAWKAFPEQRLRILETIRIHKIKNVVIVSGDVHGSMTSRLRYSEDPDFEVHTIVSSPFCNSAWLPYAKASNFILDQPLVQTATGDYRLELTSKVISQDNFAHLTVDVEKIRVEYRDSNGDYLDAVNLALHIPL